MRDRRVSLRASTALHWREVKRDDPAQRWYVLPITLEAAACLEGDEGWKAVLADLMTDLDALRGCDDAPRLLALAMEHLRGEPDWYSWKRLLEERVTHLPTPHGRALLALQSAVGEQMRDALPDVERVQARPLAVELHLRLARIEEDRQTSLEHLDQALALALETGSTALILRVREAELELLDLPLDDPASLQLEEDRGVWLAACQRLRHRLRPRTERAKPQS